MTQFDSVLHKSTYIMITIFDTWAKDRIKY